MLQHILQILLVVVFIRTAVGSMWTQPNITMAILIMHLLIKIVQITSSNACMQAAFQQITHGMQVVSHGLMYQSYVTIC